MMRTAPVLLFLLCLAAAAVSAQQPVIPVTGNDALFTSDLIVWTHMQTPQPAQQQAPPAQEKQPKAEPQAEARPQSFSGTIVKEGNSYVLRTSDQWFYDLDDQQKAELYENQRVGVVGTLNPGGDLIHVREIQPAH
jgi:Protein of unknown function (DUF5818)